MFRMEEFRVVFLDRVILLIPVERRMKNFHLAPRFFFSVLCFYRTHKRALFVLSSSKFDQPYIKTRFVQPLIRSALFRRIHRGMRHVLRNGYGSM